MASASNSWDSPGSNFQSGSSSSNALNNSTFIRNQAYGNVPMINTPLGRVPVAPPLPPRPSYNSVTNNYSSHAPFYNNYGLGGYSGYGGYGNYGYGYRPGFSSYGYGYSHDGYYGGGNPESRFIKLAEESSRPAFQSIQSVLQAFSSLTMMFESTFHAIYSSYMSVIGVADNFGRLRSIFSQMLSTFAVIRALKWVIRKFGYLLGILKIDPAVESSWDEAFRKTSEAFSEHQVGSKRPTLPVLLFLTIIMAGPYLLFKLMNQIYPNPNRELWNPIQNPGSLAVGMYDFNSSNAQELSFSAHQKLMVAPEKFQPSDCPGWVLACNESKKIGLVPNNYIGMIMQSEKTGKTYLEHNGQKLQPQFTNSAPEAARSRIVEAESGEPSPTEAIAKRENEEGSVTDNQK